MVVNSSRGGGAKDTWIIVPTTADDDREARGAERCADWPVRCASTVRRPTSRPSSAADRAWRLAARTAAGLGAGPVALGHRRLSIIDLSAAGVAADGRPELGLTVVFNGCIYNYQELRAELRGRGYRFFSHVRHRGDPQGLRRSGAPTASSGSRACSPSRSSSGDSGRLVLGRDRLGIKPLYLDQTADRLRFASTLPALLAAGGVDTSIDPVALPTT